ncbi:hypothetical protein G6O69_33305 [Pseudenhygromyxa sp. WMMC2535]|uniref:globin domain-containing protein n=1 Tax=Pseudenhygromyxa sp. WMMC2535 TaxID=2712867 RepID=UPI00155381FE|nr:globin domain-containing protein [Pseudenhygromyxa sp. WMMC2535]NVB42747.1 hypothetical protein [Pseudenhygromyxa sp. WMMC2535]
MSAKGAGMNDASIAIVKATIPALREQGEAITERMYARMFAAHPEVERMFNPSHMRPGGQASTLAASILAYAEHIERPEVLRAALERIAHRHVAVQVRPEQYAIVGEHLLGAIVDVLGEAASPEVCAAWAEAYAVLADVLVAREDQLYTEQTSDPGGWSGLRRFRIVGLREEGARARSLYLMPSDGGQLPRFVAGQHVSVRVPGHEHLALRQYSLSQSPDQPELRLTVRRETGGSGCPVGAVSGLLHSLRLGDEIDLGAPCGSFTIELADDPSAPLVAIAGGVGITPLAAIIARAAATQPERELVLIHAVRSQADRPLAADLDDLALRHPRLRLEVLCEDEDGRLSLAKLAAWLPEGAQCLFCGPPGFLAAVEGWLTELGVPASRRHYECFGPRDAAAPSVHEPRSIADEEPVVMPSDALGTASASSTGSTAGR